MRNTSLRFFYAFVISTFILLSGCAGVQFAHPPQVNLDSNGQINKKESFVKQVYYGTTRFSRTFSKNIELDRFDTGNEQTSTYIKYGQVDVRIPYIKKIGTTDGMSIVKITDDIGWNEFKKDISSDDLLIYIHGFNTSFNDAAIRCAQLAHDLNYHGKPVVFSWPAGNKGPSGYPIDRKRADENIVHLADFLQRIAEQSTKKVHIVAHSMGSIILVNSLAELEQRVSKDKSLFTARKKNHAKIFDQIVFAASDVEKNEFNNLFVKNKLIDLAKGYTLYATSNDYVLIASRFINYYIDETKVPRVGDSSKSFFTIKGVDTIDGRLEADPQIIGHSYYAEDKGFVTDLFLLFNYELRPDRRLLISVKDKTEQQLWFLRP